MLDKPHLEVVWYSRLGWESGKECDTDEAMGAEEGLIFSKFKAWGIASYCDQLLCHNWQHLWLNFVQVVEASPRSTPCNTFNKLLNY